MQWKASTAVALFSNSSFSLVGERSDGVFGELLHDQTFILIANENHLCRECSFPKQENLSCFTKQKLYMLPILWFFIRPSPCSALPEFKKSINRGWNEAGEVLRARQWLVGCEQPQMPKMHKNFSWWSRGSKVQRWILSVIRAQKYIFGVAKTQLQQNSKEWKACAWLEPMLLILGSKVQVTWLPAAGISTNRNYGNKMHPIVLSPPLALPLALARTIQRLQ